MNLHMGTVTMNWATESACNVKYFIIFWVIYRNRQLTEEDSVVLILRTFILEYTVHKIKDLEQLIIIKT